MFWVSSFLRLYSLDDKAGGNKVSRFLGLFKMKGFDYASVSCPWVVLCLCIFGNVCF